MGSFSIQTITALVNVATGGSGNSDKEPIGIYRSGSQLEDFMGAAGLKLHIGSTSRVPAVREVINAANEDDSDAIARLIEQVADPREYLDCPDKCIAVVEYLNARLIIDGYELQKISGKYKLVALSKSKDISHMENVADEQKAEKPEDKREKLKIKSKDTKNDQGKVQQVYKKIKNHPIVSILLIIVTFIIGLAAFLESIGKLRQFGSKFFGIPSQPQSQVASDAHKPKPSMIASPDASPVDPKHPLPKKEPKENTNPSEKKSQGFDNIDSTPTLPPIRQSNSDIRKTVNVAATALQGETTSNRVRSVEALLSNLPENLNAREIALLAGSETTSHREQILELLVKRTKLSSLAPEDIPLILGTETTSNRERCIRIIAPYIRPPITGKHAVDILGSESHSYRVGCLWPIVALLQRPISKTEVEGILRNTSGSDRSEAIKVLFGQAKE
ncbi:MAG: hypothetical protein JXA11_03760 [Phycisphaerae bacterium]|nr:hypothetical protein [Phycisphaerae bacterium]